MKFKIGFSAEAEEDGYVTGQGGGAIPLDDLGQLGANSAVYDRGKAYYMENKVAYLSLDAGQGRAIVLGSRPYEVEFHYDEEAEEVSGLLCPCLCSYPCKHQVAALLQLQDILEHIWESNDYYFGGYFAAVSRDVFFSFALDARKDASITLG